MSNHISKRLLNYCDIKILEYLQCLVKIIKEVPVPNVLSNGDRLGCNVSFVVDMLYYSPNGNFCKNEHHKIAWFYDTDCFDWTDNHNASIDICNI